MYITIVRLLGDPTDINDAIEKNLEASRSVDNASRSPASLGPQPSPPAHESIVEGDDSDEDDESRAITPQTSVPERDSANISRSSSVSSCESIKRLNYLSGCYLSSILAEKSLLIWDVRNLLNFLLISSIMNKWSVTLRSQHIRFLTVTQGRHMEYYIDVRRVKTSDDEIQPGWLLSRRFDQMPRTTSWFELIDDRSPGFVSSNSCRSF